MQPLYIDLTGKKVVIVGGGRIAARKGRTLAEEKAQITFIAPEFSKELLTLAEEKGCSLHKRKAEPSDFDRAFLIILATNNSLVNEGLAKKISPNQLVCVADDATEGNVVFPATFNRGQLQIAVTTNGASPKLTKKIKNDLEAQFDESWERYTQFLYQCRTLLKKLSLSMEERNRKLGELLDDQYRIDEMAQAAKLEELMEKARVDCH